MGVKFTDLIPAPRTVPVSKEHSFPITALSLQQLAIIIKLYRNEMMKLMETARKEGDLSAVVVLFPDLVVDLIAMATDTDDPEQREAIRKLPAAVQVVALTEIWEASVPDPKQLWLALDRMGLSLREAAASVQKSSSNVATLPQPKEAA